VKTRWTSADAIPAARLFAPPDGNRSRLFLGDESKFSGISLRTAGQHRSSVAGGERKRLITTVSLLAPRMRENCVVVIEVNSMWLSAKMRIKLKLTVLVAVLVIGVGVLVLGKIYLIRDDSGGELLWNGSEAYLFMGVSHRGFQIGYLEYPWVVLKELLYGVRGPDDQRTSVTVVHITASGVDRHVVEALDEEQANTPDLYTL
jgi:hypothetical protein